MMPSGMNTLTTAASATLGFTWGWLLVLVLRRQRGRAGFLAAALATIAAVGEVSAFAGGAAAGACAAAALVGTLVHGAWLHRLRQAQARR
jgi:hypothetical protein